MLPRQLRFGLLRVRSPLLAQSLLFSFPPGSEMFQFPGFASAIGGWRACARRVAPFGNPRIIRVFAPTHGLSQLVTSFVASESQGILHVPFSPFLLLRLLTLRQISVVRCAQKHIRPMISLVSIVNCLSSPTCVINDFRFQYVNVLFVYYPEASRLRNRSPWQS